MKNVFTKTILLLSFFGLSFKTTQAQFVTIPDSNFVAWLNAHYPSCMNGNLMDTTCSEIVNETLVNCGGAIISDLTGIQYFDNLYTLGCHNNQLTTLPILPNSLYSLSCQNNQITFIPALPDSLVEMWCNSNYLTSLPTLPNSLNFFECQQNQLTSLPSLPQSLGYINCDNNNLTSLPALPNILSSLHCNYNQLTSLPNLPSNMYWLALSNNQLTNLPGLPPTLTSLDCSINQLMNLPSLPSTLIILNVEGNNLSSLPVLPSQLQDLKCSYNQLSTLPSLPNTLITLNCYQNPITVLPILANSLEILSCFSCLLNDLPSLPNSLTYLNCGNNTITNLPLLPIGLESLICFSNQLSSLPILPGNLGVLSCSYNQLNALPPLPQNLYSFICGNNHISCFPVFPTTLTSSLLFGISNNPATCLPNYVTAMNAATLSMPLCQNNDSINNPNSCNSSMGIVGTVFQDNNTNCVLNSNDIGILNIKLNIYNPLTNQFGITYSSFNGIYNFPLGPSNYFVIVDTLNKPYQANCLYPGIDSTVVTTTLNPLASNVNFDIKCKPGLDLNVQSVNHKDGLIFPGQQHTLQVMVGDASQWYGLNCASGSSGQVQITITGPVTNTGTAAGALTPTVNGNVYTYTIADFGTIDNETDFQLLFTTDTSAQAGDQICVHVEVTPILGDINTANNIKDYCYNVVNSYDPNYKEVYPTNVAPLFQDWLTYTIHFQNLGTAPAINIRLLDTLDSNLDAETFEVINYSHYNTVTLMDGIIDFRFPNILLPDSASNPSGSQGFVQYRVKPKANLGAGTQIENTAHIYFDYNPAVVTNTTVNNFTTTVGNKSLPQSSRLWLYPNPSTGVFTISAKANIEVYNIVGDLILSENNATSIDLTAAPKGMYFVKLNGGKIEKLIKN